MKRRPRMIFKLTLFVFAGAIVNVAVAWGCAVWGVPRFESSPEMRKRMREPSSMWKSVTPRDAERWEGTLIACWSETWGLQSSRFTAHVDLKGTLVGVSELCDVDVTCSGWPMLSMAGWVWAHVRVEKLRASHPTLFFEPEFSHAAIRLEAIRDTRAARGMRIVLPLNPLWPGFAINTMFYAAILWMLFGAPFVIRRRMRIKRGQCASCGYSLRESASEKCPECGASAQRAT